MSPPESELGGPALVPTQEMELTELSARQRCSCLRKVNELDALTGGKYDLVLSNKEHGENVRG